MKYETPGTLAYWMSLPYFKKYEASNIKCSQVAKVCEKFKNDNKQNLAEPDNEALMFYGYNHAVSLVKKSFTPYEPLPDWAEGTMSEYASLVELQAPRLLYYIIIICTREARHLHQGKLKEADWKDVITKFGLSFRTFCDGIPGDEKGAMNRFMNSPPDMTLLQYMRGLAHVFYMKGKWSGGYGGPPWGNICDATIAFLSGKSSMEVLIDTAWTLAHNGGPMFNKGMLYNMYSHALYKVLDVQRAGQIPEMILSGHMSSSPVLAQRLTTLQNQLKCFGSVVDWDAVNAAGALHGPYASEKAAQAKLMPQTPPAPPKWLPKGAKVTGSFQVTPKQLVVQFIRKVA